MEPLPLFVFGTLRRGQCNHEPYLAGKYQRCLPARLPGFARVAPLMIARAGDQTVEGELYFLQAEGYRQTMEPIDRLESIAPGQTAGPEYRRIKARVETAEGEYVAWAYVHPETEEGNVE